MPPTSPIPSASATKKKEILGLVDVLKGDVVERNLEPQQRNNTLAQLKSLVTTPDDARWLSNQEAIKLLGRYGFDDDSLETSRAALKCLANVLLLQSETRQMFVDLGYASKAAERMKNDNWEDELLTSRVLFLSTYDTELDFDDLFNSHHLAESINQNIARHSKGYSKSRPHAVPNPIQTQALSETMKLLFNLTQFYPQQAPKFTESLPHILKVLSRIELPSPVLQPPITFLVNSLLNLDFPPSTPSPLFPASSPQLNTTRLIQILDLAIRTYKDEDLETLATPLITLLRKLHAHAPPPLATHLRTALLPSNAERAQPLGTSSSLASFLLRLSTSPAAPTIRESVSSLLFELSDADATTFVRNVGYGFASGYLMTHNIPMPSHTLNNNNDIASNSGTAEDLGEKVTTTVDGQEINPITGQRRDMEPRDEGPDMTDEEKEREAEKLFVLFERLKATGVVEVVNPVERAVREGRFEEVE